jgi:hypothetical protein
MRIGVLSNLRADQRNSKIDQVLRLLARHPDVFHLETSNGEDVAPALAEMEGREIAILVLNGGDGTVQHALTHLRRKGSEGWQPHLAPLCAGRTNTIAGDLGARRNPVQGLTDLIETVGAGRMSGLIVERPVIRAEIEEGVQYGMFLGFGMLHRAVRLVHESFPEGKARGTWGAGVVTATLVVRAAVRRGSGGILADDDIEVALDGQPFAPRTMRLAMVCTLRHLFFGIVPFWGKEPAPLQTTFVEARAEHVGRVAISILRGRPGPLVSPEYGYHSRNVHALDVRLDGGLILDGELFDPIPRRLVRITADEDVRWLRA